MKKYFFILAAIVLTLYSLKTIQFIVKPLLAAMIISMLLKPFCETLEHLKIPRSISSLFCVLILILILISFSLFVIFEIKSITSDSTDFTNAFESATNQIQKWVAGHLGVEPTEQITYLKKSSLTLLKNSMTFLQNTLSETADFFTEFFLFLIAVYFFLNYRTFLTKFLFKCFEPAHHPKVSTILSSIQKIIRKYISGLLLVILTIAVLNTIGLLLLGIKHAVFFATLAGILTIIPYIGITIGATLPVLYALATTNSIWYPTGVLLIFGSVQFLEGNFITPNIIGKQVRLNAFASLIILFLGGKFFGLLGVILSLPVLAMIKIILDNIHSLKPVAYLLGNPEH